MKKVSNIFSLASLLVLTVAIPLHWAGAYAYPSPAYKYPYPYPSPSYATPGVTISGSGKVTGDLRIDGVLSKGGGSFVIDHPQDPANKLLVHYFVESPEMKNIYDGTVVLNVNGEARVTLPPYFEALNVDYRYQLTPVGVAAPNLYVKQEVTDNEFVIAGGSSGLKVSWQVTGVRDDEWARAHRVPNEIDKSDEVGIPKGEYLFERADVQSGAGDNSYIRNFFERIRALFYGV